MALTRSERRLLEIVKRRTKKSLKQDSPLTRNKIRVAIEKAAAEAKAKGRSTQEDRLEQEGILGLTRGSKKRKR